MSNVLAMFWQVMMMRCCNYGDVDGNDKGRTADDDGTTSMSTDDGQITIYMFIYIVYTSLRKCVFIIPQTSVALGVLVVLCC